MEIEINAGAAGVVSGLLRKPPRAHACYVFAHGAGAGMTHAFMAAVACRAEVIDRIAVVVNSHPIR